MSNLTFDLQLLNTFAALLLLSSFAMLSQRRVVTMVNLLAFQGVLLGLATLLLGWRTGNTHLYVSAAMTLALKALFLPWLLHRLIRRLNVYWDSEPLLNIAATTLYAAAFVLRRRGARSTGQSCALAGYAIALGAAWFGGDLVFDQRIGVTHAAVDEPESFTPIANSGDGTT